MAIGTLAYLNAAEVCMSFLRNLSKLLLIGGTVLLPLFSFAQERVLSLTHFQELLAEYQLAAHQFNFDRQHEIEMELSTYSRPSFDLPKELVAAIRKADFTGSTYIPSLQSMLSEPQWVSYFEQVLPQLSGRISIQRSSEWYAVADMLSNFVFNGMSGLQDANAKKRLTNLFNRLCSNYPTLTSEIQFSMNCGYILQYQAFLGDHRALSQAKGIVDRYLNRRGLNRSESSLQAALFAIETFRGNTQTMAENRSYLRQIKRNSQIPEYIRSKLLEEENADQRTTGTSGGGQ